MQENARVRGLYTLCKWIDNTSPKSVNRLVTMTLGKYGFVSSDYSGPSPRHDEFWLVRIDREIKANTLQGCFVLTPVKHIERCEIEFLVPGLGQYTEFYEEGIRYIIPTDRDKYYLLPLMHRKGIKDVRSVIVVNYMLAKFNNTNRYFHFPSESGYLEEQEATQLQHKPTQIATTSTSYTGHQPATHARSSDYADSQAHATSSHPSLSAYAQKTPYDG